MDSEAQQSSFGEQRAALVSGLRAKGIRDERVLSAINTIPRHLFVSPDAVANAYDDIALPIASDQTISQPYTVAFQTGLLQVNAGMKVLEIGTGSGFQAAVLATLGARVFSIERIRLLYKHLPPAGLESWFPGVTFLYGDGSLGHPAASPFDRILVTAAAAAVPHHLLRQLAKNGMLVMPLGASGAEQRMIRIRKTETGFEEEDFGAFQFVPLLPGTT
jgi:protein-L-isoaspartate(D-aspartate) O-methyltransferase